MEIPSSSLPTPAVMPVDDLSYDEEDIDTPLYSPISTSSMGDIDLEDLSTDDELVSAQGFI